MTPGRGQNTEEEKREARSSPKLHLTEMNDESLENITTV